MCLTSYFRSTLRRRSFVVVKKIHSILYLKTCYVCFIVHSKSILLSMNLSFSLSHTHIHAHIYTYLHMQVCTCVRFANLLHVVVRVCGSSKCVNHVTQNYTSIFFSVSKNVIFLCYSGNAYHKLFI